MCDISRDCFSLTLFLDIVFFPFPVSFNWIMVGQQKKRTFRRRSNKNKREACNLIVKRSSLFSVIKPSSIHEITKQWSTFMGFYFPPKRRGEEKREKNQLTWSKRFKIKKLMRSVIEKQYIIILLRSLKSKVSLSVHQLAIRIELYLIVDVWVKFPNWDHWVTDFIFLPCKWKCYTRRMNKMLVFRKVSTSQVSFIVVFDRPKGDLIGLVAWIFTFLFADLFRAKRWRMCQNTILVEFQERGESASNEWCKILSEVIFLTVLIFIEQDNLQGYIHKDLLKLRRIVAKDNDS